MSLHTYYLLPIVYRIYVQLNFETALIFDRIKSKLPDPTMAQQFEVVRYGNDRINYKETSDINQKRPKKGQNNRLNNHYAKNFAF